MNPSEIILLIAEGEGLAVEFKEKYTPKISQDICGFANSMGGKIILGVADDGTVKGEKLTGAMKAEIFSLGRNCDPPIEVKVAQTGQVVVVTVPVGDDKPHASGGSYYKRFDAVTQKLNRNEIKAVFEANAHFHFDEKVDPRATLEDISLDKVRAFIKETGKSLSVTKKTLPLLFESLKLTRNGRITNAGIMMFVKDPGKFVMHCQTHMAAFKGTERVNIYDKKYVRNDLLTQFNEAVAFCEKHLNERAEIRGVNRYDIYEIPMEAIREAIVNAIVHRDYSMGGTNVMVEVHADRVEISNPGGLPPGFSTAMLGKKSFRRNEVIADLFHRMDKSERMGSGIERIRRTLKSAGVKAPKFESDLFFTIVFERPEEYRTVKDGNEVAGKSSQKRYLEKVARKGSLKLSASSKRILDLIKNNPLITIAELAAQVGISIGAIKKHIVSLKRKSLIRRVGPDKGGHWECL